MANAYGKLFKLSLISGVPAARAKVFPYGSLPFYFHTPPGEYRVSGTKNRSEQIIPRYGTVSQNGGPGLRSVSFDSFFSVRQWLELDDNPRTDQIEYPSYIIPPNDNLAFFDAFQSIEMLETLRDGDYPVKLEIFDRQIGGAFNELGKPMNVEVSEFEWSEVDGEPDIRKYSITMIEWKPTLLRQVPHAGGIPSTGKPRPAGSGCGVYKVPKDGVGIKDIAKHCYGRADRYKYIIAKNGGDKHMQALKAKKKAEYRPNHNEGPWFFDKGVTLKTPPYPKPKKPKPKK